jgi:hypothetical protein
MESENGRFFEVSKVRIGPDGHVSDVLWGEVKADADKAVGTSVLATALEVVDAIHAGAHVAAVFPSKDRRAERALVVVEHLDGRQCIAFDGQPSPGRNLSDLDRLAD